MANWSKQDAAELILLAGAASGIVAAFNPSWFTTCSKFFHENGVRDANVKRIRAGYIAAGIIVIAMGWAVASQTKSNIALYGAIGLSVFFGAAYEWCMAHPASGDE